jgi:hypothetical protein
VSGLTVTAILLGGGLSIFFILSMVLIYFKPKPEPAIKGEPRTTNSLPRKCAGAYALIVGLVMLSAWVFFLMKGRESLVSQLSALILHVILMFISSIVLIVAGVAMIRHWHRSALLFYSALAFSSFSVFVSLFEYGNRGHPILMNGIAIVLVIVLAYFIGLAYAFEHFIFHLDTDEKDSDNPDPDN